MDIFLKETLWALIVLREIKQIGKLKKKYCWKKRFHYKLSFLIKIIINKSKDTIFLEGRKKSKLHK